VPAKTTHSIADEVALALQLELDVTLEVRLEETTHGQRGMVGVRSPKRKVFIPCAPVAAVGRMLLTDDPHGSRRLSSQLDLSRGIPSTPHALSSKWHSAASHCQRVALATKYCRHAGQFAGRSDRLTARIDADS